MVFKYLRTDQITFYKTVNSLLVLYENPPVLEFLLGKPQDMIFLKSEIKFLNFSCDIRWYTHQVSQDYYFFAQKGKWML
jgi:hypothetical protein